MVNPIINGLSEYPLNQPFASWFPVAHLSQASTASAPWRKDLWKPPRKLGQLAPQAIVFDTQTGIVIECHRCAQVSCNWSSETHVGSKSYLQVSLYSGQSCQSGKLFKCTSPTVRMGMGDLLWPKHIYDGTKIRTSSKSTAKQRRCRMTAHSGAPWMLRPCQWWSWFRLDGNLSVRQVGKQPRISNARMLLCKGSWNQNGESTVYRNNGDQLGYALIIPTSWPTLSQKAWHGFRSRPPCELNRKNNNNTFLQNHVPLPD
jgi:hypothetical protein